MKNFNLKELNSFQIEVSAKYFSVCNNMEDLKQCIESEEFQKSRKLILGGGSNILFTKDFDGFILKPELQGIQIIAETDVDVVVRACSGVIWDDFVKYSISKEYYGVENLSGIPGVVGAVPIQNIGAYGCEAKDIIHQVRTLDIVSGKIATFANSDCNFGYRDSIFKNELKDKHIVVSVDFKLSKIPKYNLSYHILGEKFKNRIPNLINIRNEIINIRKSKLPDPKILGNGGSFFKNPVIDIEQFRRLKEKYPEIPPYQVSERQMKVPAGWMIEKCGLKGFIRESVGIYDKQALIIVNYGQASGREILEFSEFIKYEVRKKFLIELEEEIKII